MKNFSELLEHVKFQELPGILVYDNVQCEEYSTHWHASVEIIMPMKNKFHVQCGVREYYLREGDILIISPGTPHALYASEGRRLIVLAELSGVKVMENMEPLFSAMEEALLITPEEFPGVCEKIRSNMDMIFWEYFGTASYRGVAVLSSLLNIFSLTAEKLKGEEPGAQENKTDYQRDQIAVMMKICQHIQEHCTDNLTLESVSALAGFSKYHFSRKFKDTVGISFYKYLNQCRIARAEELMEKTSNSITDVAIMCGFNSISAFIRMFKIINGCTPNEFRNEKKRD